MVSFSGIEKGLIWLDSGIWSAGLDCRCVSAFVVTIGKESILDSLVVFLWDHRFTPDKQERGLAGGSLFLRFYKYLNFGDSRTRPGKFGYVRRIS
jgi:hypothetical protein